MNRAAFLADIACAVLVIAVAAYPALLPVPNLLS